MMLQYYLIVGAVFGLMLVPVAFSQIQVIQDSEPDPKTYKRVQAFIVYDTRNIALAETLVILEDTEQRKYTYKEITKTPEVENRGKYSWVEFSRTFNNDVDALSYWDNVILTIRTGDVVYADVLLLDNTHHYNRPLPDKIIDRIEIGIFPEDILD